MPFTSTDILAALEKGGQMSTAQLMQALELRSSERRELSSLLTALSNGGPVQRVGGKQWRLVPGRALNGRDASLTGRLQMTRRGFGFVRLEEGDVLVPFGAEGTALDGDTVVVRITGRSSKGPSGVVTRVVERATTRFVGMYQRSGPRRALVTPRNPHFNRRIEVPWADDSLGIADFDWVEVDIDGFTEPPQPLRGKVVERLGGPKDEGIDVLLLLRDMGIVAEFPHAVEQAAEALALDVEEEVPRRRDLRRLLTATIDPATAKDFDDAISIEPLDGGGWRLFVHIADVSHYVRPDDPIDHEAVERSTSVYPVDRVVPMLPERLSNDLCSLRPGEDRLAMTAEMVVSADGKVSQEKVYSSIIHSDRRYAYEEAQAVFEGGGDEPDHLKAMLFAARDCARALRKARFARGALDLDIPEVEILFHESGEVSELGLSERFEAHMTIEDCMLAANESAARLLTKAGAPMLYRIHTPAEPERLERLALMLKALGIRLPIGRDGGLEPGSLQGVLRTLENRRGGHILRRLVLRALQRACYSPKNGGHFGLASKCYCHFTSPIRRYPDVVVHRQLRSLERNEPLVYDPEEGGFEDLEELGRHCSVKEREAEDAERQSVAIKSVEYLKQFEGEEFDGLVASIHGFGIFVEVQPHGFEGLCPLAKVPGDRWEVDELGVELVGMRTGRAIRLTDEVRVRLLKARPFEGMLDLEVVAVDGEEVAQHDKRRRSPKRHEPFYKKVAKGGKRGKKRR